jgi:putative SOS response-associated peptidase YedK
VPYFIYMPNHEPFSFGGIYSHWTHPDTGEVFTTFSIITTEANELMSQIHNIKKRMPLIIQPKDREKWLAAITEAEIKELMQPLPDGILQAHTISKLITTRGADNNVPEVQAAYKEELF